MSKVVLVCGPPASGKSTVSEEYIKKGYVHLNRDKAGGKVADLLPALEKALKADKDVVIDNTFPTKESRKPFIDLCRRTQYMQDSTPIHCVLMDTKIEDAQINALCRMYERHSKYFFHPDDLKGVNDPNMFPVAALFRYRKEFQAPSTAEGFDSVEVVKFKRRPWGYTNKALILDYDDTLRIVNGNAPRNERNGELGYPCHPDEVSVLNGRTEKIKQYKDAGYILLGVSNQSGIAKGNLTHDDAIACFERTNELLGIKIDYHFCPHQSSPPVCYCRKPQSGLLVMLTNKHRLNPSECLFVGDQTSDKTAAERMGIPFEFADKFFAPNC